MFLYLMNLSRDVPGGQLLLVPEVGQPVDAPVGGDGHPDQLPGEELRPVGYEEPPDPAAPEGADGQGLGVVVGVVKVLVSVTRVSRRRGLALGQQLLLKIRKRTTLGWQLQLSDQIRLVIWTFS